MKDTGESIIDYLVECPVQKKANTNIHTLYHRLSFAQAQINQLEASLSPSEKRLQDMENICRSILIIAERNQDSFTLLSPHIINAIKDYLYFRQEQKNQEHKKEPSKIS